MKFCKIPVFILIFFVLFSVSFADTKSSAYCIMDGATKKVLKEKDCLRQLSPASTVKLLTALVVLENAKVEQIFTASEKAVNVSPTKIGLSQGDEMTCKDLLIGLLVESGNDAAVVLAEGVAKTEEQFAQLMNKKAQQLGCQNSCFKTSHGLPAKGQYSCAYDLALIALEAAKSPLICEILAIKKTKVKTSKGKELFIVGHNKSLDGSTPVYGKTGYTDKSRNTFAGFCNVGGKLVCVAILAAPKRAILWQEMTTLIQNLVKETAETPGQKAGQTHIAKNDGKETPGNKAPQGEPSKDGKTPDSKTPDSKTPDSKTPDNKTPDSKTPDSKTPDSKTPDAKTSANQNKPKDISDVNTTLDNETTKIIQKILKDKGFYKGEVDGIYGPKTREAVKEFQKAQGLKVDGIVGPNTWKKLHEEGKK